MSLTPSARTSLTHPCPPKGHANLVPPRQGSKGLSLCLRALRLQMSVPGPDHTAAQQHFLADRPFTSQSLRDPGSWTQTPRGASKQGPLAPLARCVLCLVLSHTCLQCSHSALCLSSLPILGSSSNPTSSVKPQEIPLTLLVNKLESHWLSFQIIPPRGLQMVAEGTTRLFVNQVPWEPELYSKQR